MKIIPSNKNIEKILYTAGIPGRMVSKPHGGRLVNRVLPPDRARRAAASGLPRVEVPIEFLLDAEKLATGAYSPLDGFADRRTLRSILRTWKLPGGAVWPIPVVLPVEKELERNEDVLLTQSGRSIARLRVRECYPLDRRAFAKGVYGTEDPAHPNVAEVLRWPPFLAAGPVDRIARPGAGLDEPTPAETRAEFKRRGWETVAGYQTRNPPHRAHEYLQRCALEQVDGLFIHPVVGKLKPDDFSAAAILESYSAMVRVYPPGRALLAPLSIAMRYAGPRAAVFLALVRKNYGCTHYIVGRDMAGVGKFYGPYDAQEALARWDIGITPLLFRDVFWCDRCGSMATEKTCGHGPGDRRTLSGTEVRRRLRAGEPVPPEMMRPEVAEVLRKHVAGAPAG